jgi:hypothetical protein
MSHGISSTFTAVHTFFGIIATWLQKTCMGLVIESADRL